MLVLTRRLGESIAIGDEIRITIIAIKGNQVKIGIEAPPEVTVHRAEVYTKIVAENHQAVATGHVHTGTLRALWQQHTRRT